MPIAADRTAVLLAAAARSHRGVFITGPGRLEARNDELPAEALEGGSHIITASLGNCRCTSDSKAIKQFTAHARVPSDATQIALGHETVQVVLAAPPETGLQPGQLVVLTPGHSSEPVDPRSFAPDRAHGVLAALGYSYRHLGGLRRFNAIPVEAIRVVAQHGFGELFSTVPANAHSSLASLAHAEPFACNYGTNKHVFSLDGQGGFRYGVPPRANIAYLGGTARMAMINLTIVASVPDEQLPRVVSITGSSAKLDELADFALIRRLRTAGTIVELIDRRAQDIQARLIAHGRCDVIWTNFAAPEVYDQAAAAIAPGGNINNYAGASDPSLCLEMAIAPAPVGDAAFWLGQVHHNLVPNDPQRHSGLAPGGLVHLAGFDPARRAAWLAALPAGTRITRESLGAAPAPADLVVVDATDGLSDVFIAGTGAAAASRYAELEPLLARNAAVALVDGDTIIAIHSRHTHYTSRHQICGPNVPWHMTNTSEPLAEDLRRQVEDPVDFDWMLRGVCGLEHAVKMMREVEATQPFGSYFVYNDLPDLPFIATTAAACHGAARDADPVTAEALTACAAVLDETSDQWCRRCEEALYAAYGVPYPLA